MRIIVRTIYGSALQTAKQLGINHLIEPFASLNDAMTDPLIVPNLPSVITTGMEVCDPYDPDTDTIGLNTQYFAIGNHGHRNVGGPIGGVPYSSPVPHKSSDSGLYGMIPFVAKPVTADLSTADREKYRLRRTVLIGGILYALYYLRRMDVASITPDNILVTVVDGQSIPTAFSPTVNNLRPPPPPIGTANDGSYLQSSAKITVEFSPEEVTLLKDACALVFGDENYAIISEIAICHAVEKEVTGKYPDSGTQTIGAGPADTYEAVGVQVAAHISTYYPVIYTNAGFDFTIDLGVTEPLFGLNIS